MICRIAPDRAPVHHRANDGRPFPPMRNPLSWLLALLLCWQALAAAAVPAAVPPGHTSATVAAHSGDCGHAEPEHRPESHHQTAGLCATQCQHCPSLAYLPAPGALPQLPAASDPPARILVPAPAHLPSLIYRPPITA